jgi:hypothetical protein
LREFLLYGVVLPISGNHNRTDAPASVASGLFGLVWVR